MRKVGQRRREGGPRSCLVLNYCSFLSFSSTFPLCILGRNQKKVVSWRIFPVCFPKGKHGMVFHCFIVDFHAIFLRYDPKRSGKLRKWIKEREEKDVCRIEKRKTASYISIALGSWGDMCIFVVSNLPYKKDLSDNGNTCSTVKGASEQKYLNFFGKQTGGFFTVTQECARVGSPIDRRVFICPHFEGASLVFSPIDRCTCVHRVR